MKHLQFSLAAGALILAFTFPAFAGEIGTMVASTGRIPSDATAFNPLAEVALNLLQSVLSMF
jgi:hypothetical protein